ncbi:MAG: hypothetical protein AABZ64_17080, partial [Nitrospinota bacterium]
MLRAGDAKACLQAIRKVTGELTSTLDVKEVLRDVVRITADVAGAKGSALRLLDGRTGRLELSAAWGLSESYLAKGPIDGGRGLADCMKGQIVHFRDVRTDPRVVDINRDGRQDLVVSSLRTDLFAGLKGAALKSVSVSYYIYL